MPTGAAAVPYVAQPAVTGAVVDRRSEVTHSFLNVIRSIIRNSGVFHEEELLLEALRAVDSYSRQVLGSDHVRVIREEDHAPVEDVKLRKPPPGTVPNVPGPQIDYRKLAEAFFAIQQEQAQAQGGQIPPPGEPQ